MEVYAAMIDRMDQNIGRVLDKLKEQGKFEDTIIIFVSDNGASAEMVNLDSSYGEIGTLTCWTSLGGNWANVCNTPFRYFKNYSYEGGICAPMIISWPNGLKHPGRNSDFTSHFIDIMATLVDLTGVPYPTKYNGHKVLPYEGTSLMPVIRDEKTKRHTPLFWEWQNGKAVRNGKWKIVKHGADSPWSLYNIDKDPSETVDLSSRHPLIVGKMNDMYDKWYSRTSK